MKLIVATVLGMAGMATQRAFYISTKIDVIDNRQLEVEKKLSEHIAMTQDAFVTAPTRCLGCHDHSRFVKPSMR